MATVTVQADHIPPLVISLRALSLKYSPGDHVKHRFADSLGILSTVDEDRRKVTFVEKDTNEEYLAHMDTVEPYSPHSNFFRFTPGLWVHFRGPRDSERPKRRGYITAVEGAHTRVTDERTFTEFEIPNGRGSTQPCFWTEELGNLVPNFDHFCSIFFPFLPSELIWACLTARGPPCSPSSHLPQI